MTPEGIGQVAGTRPAFRKFLLSFSLMVAAHGFAADIHIGSKRFTESYVLGEIATKLLRDEGFSADHRPGMGGTIILWEALKGGAIDAYPEYTGTITEEILHTRERLPLPRIASELAQHGVGNNGRTRVQQHLRAGDAARSGRLVRDKAHQRFEKSSRSALGPDARIS